MSCRICTGHVDCLYESTRSVGITSMASTAECATRVWFCKNCGHLQSDVIANIEQYYDDAYNINIANDEEDQLYKIADGNPIFRNAHQAMTTLERMDVAHGARVLDYGCGPAHTSRALSAQRPDLNIHLFEVSRNYETAWQRTMPAAIGACHEIPADWYGSFDVVLSFFALEHVASPREFVGQIAALLRPCAKAYIVVPNVYRNIADFVVVDHVNHFSERSLRHLFSKAGFAVDYISDMDHNAAWTIIATRLEDQKNGIDEDEPDFTPLLQVAMEMAEFWTRLDERIRRFENQHSALSSVIYGSGFYGSYIYTALASPERVKTFVDRNPHQQAKTIHDRPICAPDTLELERAVVWVGLNPRIAKEAISQLTKWADRSYRYFYL